MLQISLPIFGDHLDFLITDKQDPKLISAYSQSLDALLAAARTHLDSYEPRSGLKKLMDSDSLNSVDLPQIVTLYAEFWLATLNNEEPYRLITNSEIRFSETMTLEKSLKFSEINTNLLVPFLLYLGVELAQVGQVDIESINSLHWGFANSQSSISFLNPLSDSLIEFSTLESGYMLDYYDHKSQTAYVLFSMEVNHLCQFQLQIHDNSMHPTIALARFSSTDPVNRIWRLDSDNLAHLIDD